MEPQTVIAGRYEIVNHLASGGMAQVYVAIQAPLGRKIALKILHPEWGADDQMVKRFYREAVAVSQLTHPNTITVHDFGTTEAGQLFLVMELLDGESLAERIGREGTVPLEDAVEIAIQVAKSLSEAHDKGIVHRDLKPDNIFLGRVERNLVKVLDFGIAANMRQPDGVTKLTQSGAIPGTPEYMSPEQAQGEQIDGRSDLYSLGIVLYEMLTGDVPFTAGTSLGVIVKHLSDIAPRLPPNYPRPIIEFVARTLEKDPNRRSRDAQTFVEDIRAASSGRSRPSPVGPNAPMRGARGPSAAPAAASHHPAAPAAPEPAKPAVGPRRPMSPADMARRRTQMNARHNEEAAPGRETQAEAVEAEPGALTPSTIERAAPAASLEDTRRREMPPPPSRSARPLPHRGTLISTPPSAPRDDPADRAPFGHRAEPVRPDPRMVPPSPRSADHRAPEQRRRVTLPGGQRGVTDEPPPRPREEPVRERPGIAPPPPRRAHDAMDMVPPPSSARRQQPVEESPYDVFLRFAEPVTSVLGARPNPNDLQQNLSFAQMSWNAASKGPETVADARVYLQHSGSPRMLEVYDSLVQRKIRHFRSHRWKVQKVVVDVSAGQTRIQVAIENR